MGLQAEENDCAVLAIQIKPWATKEDQKVVWEERAVRFRSAGESDAIEP